MLYGSREANVSSQLLLKHLHAVSTRKSKSPFLINNMKDIPFIENIVYVCDSVLY